MNLEVYYTERHVGTLFPEGDFRMRFEYDPVWRDGPDGFPISVSLPLSGDYVRGREDHRFFANLLPEAGAREALCRSLGISTDNDYELLAAVGGECAGALRILPEDSRGMEVPGYEAIGPEDLKRAVEDRIPYTRMGISGKARLSLAGARDKWPVLFREGKLFWPVGGAPSSHIIKLPDPLFKGLIWNETYMTLLAARFGLPVVEILPEPGYTLVRRYDRPYGPGGEIVRLHQEDFCQALGHSHGGKYETEGGPDLADCAELMREISASPAKDVLVLLRWHIFNLLAGNSDGHAKNLSILYTPGGPRPAPFYDLVCTRIYPGIARDMAFSTGGNHDPGQIRGRDWRRLAEDLKVNPRLVFRTLAAGFEFFETEPESCRRDFIAAYGDDPVIGRINRMIKDQTRRTKTLMND